MPDLPTRPQRRTAIAANVAVICLVFVVISPVPAGLAQEQPPDVTLESQIGALLEQSTALSRAQKFQEAIEPAQRAAALAAQTYDPDSVDLAEVLFNLATIYSVAGRSADAEPLLRRCLEIAELSFGTDAPELAPVLDALFAHYENSGRYADAELYLKRGLRVKLATFGENHTNVALHLNNLAVHYDKQGRNAEAEPLYKRSLAILEAAPGDRQFEMAFPLAGLISSYRLQERYADAEPIIQRALQYVDSSEFKGSPLSASLILNIAQVRQAQGQLTEAVSLSERALKIIETTWGLEDPKSVGFLNSLAVAYLAQERFAEAEPLFKRSLALLEIAYGETHPGIAGALRGLARIHRAQGRSAEAEPLLIRSLSIQEATLGKEHADVAETLGDLAVLYSAMGRQDEVAKLRRRIAEFPPAGTRHLTAYFATNRKLETRSEPTERIRFGGEGADSVTVGRAVIQVPETTLKARAKRIGESLGQLDKARGALSEVRDLGIVRMRVLDRADIFSEFAKQSLARAARYPNSALIFVHGYNVGFDDALKRAAQIAFDLDYDGVLIPFDWASKRSWYQYLADTDSADVGVDPLIDLIGTLRSDLPDVKINIIAHSMGNLVVLRALERIAERRDADAKNAFGEIILAHADVDAARCRQLLRNVQPLVGGSLTLYTNANDWALWLSQKLRGKARCGGEAQVYEGVDTIATTGMGESWALLKRSYNHNVFVSNPLLFGEISRLLSRGERPPHARTPELAKVENDDGKTYWRYDPALDVAAQAKKEVVGP